MVTCVFLLVNLPNQVVKLRKNVSKRFYIDKNELLPKLIAQLEKNADKQTNVRMLETASLLNIFRL